MAAIDISQLNNSTTNNEERLSLAGDLKLLIV